MKIAFVVDPLDSFKIAKDTTFAIMREAAARGHVLYVLEQDDLFWHGDRVYGHARRIELTGEKLRWYHVQEPARTPLKDFDAVLMRKDPPFDIEYVYSTYLLELAEAQGASLRPLRGWGQRCFVFRMATAGFGLRVGAAGFVDGIAARDFRAVEGGLSGGASSRA